MAKTSDRFKCIVCGKKTRFDIYSPSTNKCQIKCDRCKSIIMENAPLKEFQQFLREKKEQLLKYPPFEQWEIDEINILLAILLSGCLPPDNLTLWERISE